MGAASAPAGGSGEVSASTNAGRSVRNASAPETQATGSKYVDVACTSFFFQAEDGIRDYKVTGVQTCALPILEIEDGVDRAVASCPEQIPPTGLHGHRHGHGG